MAVGYMQSHTKQVK